MGMTIRASYLKEGCSHPVSELEDDNMSVGVGTAADILAQLGYELPDGDFSAPIDEFLERAQRWCNANPEASLKALQQAHNAAIENGRHCFNPQDPSLILLKTRRLIAIAVSGKIGNATLIEAF